MLIKYKEKKASGNDIVYNYIVGSQEGEDELQQLHDEFERLMDDINNIYSFLLLTGYLKVKEKVGNNEYQLAIPNEEIRKIYAFIFKNYFDSYQMQYQESFY